MHFKTWLILGAGLLFLVGTAGYAATAIFLRPRENSDLDHYHWEFEETHPDLKRYLFWSRLFLGVVIVSMLLLMLTFSI